MYIFKIYVKLLFIKSESREENYQNLIENLKHIPISFSGLCR